MADYRPEIDGLRALAVVPVVLFHSGIGLFSGGYVGVDVFFVISGFLITSIIVREYTSGTFSLLNFYVRRARRILPVLFFVIAISSIVAWAWFLPNELKVFGQQVFAAAVFSSNIYFVVKQNNYFDFSSETNPLLHLWSLGVEEQYYFIFPCFLLLMLRYGKAVTVSAMLFLAIASFLAYAFFIDSRIAAFYLLHARAWELLAGAILAIITFSRIAPTRNSLTADILASAGLLAVVVSIFLLDKQSSIESPYLQIVPVIGTVAILLYSASPGNLVNRILTARPLVYLGVLSYSIYLWHQPVLAFIRYRNDGQLSAAMIILACAGIIVLSVFSKTYVEDKFRRPATRNHNWVFLTAISGISVAFMSFALLGHLNNGYPQRSSLFQRLDSNTGISLSCDGNARIEDGCSTGTEPKVALYGDSYAMHWVDGFRTTQSGTEFVQLTQAACPPILGFSRKNPGKRDCIDFAEEVFDTIKSHPSIESLIISSTFETLLEDENIKPFENTIVALQTLGIKISVIGPTPSTGHNIGKCFAKSADESQFESCNFERINILAGHQVKIDLLNDIAGKYSFDFFDITDLICDDSTCHVYEDGTIYYRDHGHLSREGSKALYPRLGLHALASGPEAVQN